MPRKKWSSDQSKGLEDLFDRVEDYPTLSDDEREEAQDADKPLKNPPGHKQRSDGFTRSIRKRKDHER